MKDKILPYINSESYESPKKIPDCKIKFVESTGI